MRSEADHCYHRTTEDKGRKDSEVRQKQQKATEELKSVSLDYTYTPTPDVNELTLRRLVPGQAFRSAGRWASRRCRVGGRTVSTTKLKVKVSRVRSAV